MASEEPGFGFNFGYQALKLDKCSARVVSHSLSELNQWQRHASIGFSVFFLVVLYLFVQGARIKII